MLSDEEYEQLKSEIIQRKFFINCQICKSQDIKIEATDEGESYGGEYTPSVKLCIICNCCKQRVKLPEDLWTEEWKRKGVE